MVLTVEAPLAWTDKAVADIVYSRLWDTNSGVVNITSLDLAEELNPTEKT